MFRSFPLCSCGVEYFQSRMILSGNLALETFYPLSFIDRELPLFPFHFFSIFDRESFFPFFCSFLYFHLFLFLSFHFFLLFLFTFPSPSLSLGNRVLAFHSLSLEEISLSFASGERRRILLIGQGSKKVQGCVSMGTQA